MPQSDQISNIFNPKTEEIFETIETADIDMNISHSIIEPIINRNFGNTFQHRNVPNQRQHNNINTSQQYQHRKTRKKYQHRNNSQNYQHSNTSQQHQPRPFQIPMASSITYLKQNCLGYLINNKGTRELLMQNDGSLENCPFMVPLYMHEKAPIEQLLQNNHKHGSQTKDFNKNKYKSKETGPPQATITKPRQKVSSVRFDEP